MSYDHTLRIAQAFERLVQIAEFLAHHHTGERVPKPTGRTPR